MSEFNYFCKRKCGIDCMGTAGKWACQGYLQKLGDEYKHYIEYTELSGGCLPQSGHIKVEDDNQMD